MNFKCDPVLKYLIVVQPSLFVPSQLIRPPGIRNAAAKLQKLMKKYSEKIINLLSLYWLLLEFHF